MELPVEDVPPKNIITGKAPRDPLSCHAQCPRELAQYVGRLLLAERRKRGTRNNTRALTCFWQAVMGLRWFRGHTDIAALGRDHGISRATAYRYIDEVIEVLAARAPSLHEALQRAREDSLSC